MPAEQPVKPEKLEKAKVEGEPPDNPEDLPFG